MMKVTDRSVEGQRKHMNIGMGKRRGRESIWRREKRKKGEGQTHADEEGGETCTDDAKKSWKVSFLLSVPCLLFVSRL